MPKEIAVNRTAGEISNENGCKNRTRKFASGLISGRVKKNDRSAQITRQFGVSRGVCSTSMCADFSVSTAEEDGLSKGAFICVVSGNMMIELRRFTPVKIAEILKTQGHV
jgi:hypothetical protein